MHCTGVTVGLRWLWDWVVNETDWGQSRRQCRRGNVLRCVVTRRFRTRSQLHQIVGNGAEGQLARGWGVVGLQYFGELDV